MDFTEFNYLPKDYNSIGGLILKENKLIVTFKKEVEPIKPYASFDVNLTGFINGKLVRFERVISHSQSLRGEENKTKPKTAKELMLKYSKMERNRATDLMHKITIAREPVSVKHGATLEDLMNIKNRISDSSKDLNRKLSKWNRFNQCSNKA